MKIATFLAATCILLTACQQKASEKRTVDFEKEKAAIQAVIAKETESYYKQNFEAWKSTYLQTAAFRKFGYWEGYTDKIVSNIGFESLATEKKKQFNNNETLWQGSVEERTNENFRISPEMVEAGGVEPPSEATVRRDSPRSVPTCYLVATLPGRNSQARRPA